ncbi:MAG: FAD-dependent oxidoreductase [Calditrichaceae bacterium]
MHSDVLIIGAGLGGLSAGAYLSQKGVHVTLIEEQSQVGGYAIAFQRDEFVFDVALHAIPACGPEQPFHNLLTQLNIVDEITFIKLKDAFNVNLGNYNFLIPNSFSEFFKILITEFPDEKEGLVKLQSYLYKIGNLYYNTVEGESGIINIISRFLPKIPDFLTNSYSSTDTFLSKYAKNERLKSLLYQAAVFFGEPMSQFPAINFIVMFYLLFDTGMYTIKNGGQALTNALERKIIEHNGTIIKNMRVESIQTKKNRATSVILNDGRKIHCHSIISGMNTPDLVNHLISDQSISDTYMEMVDSFKSSLSILQLHLGLDCPVEELGIKYYLNIFFPDDDIDASIYKQNNSSMIDGYSVIAPGINYPNGYSGNCRILSVVGGVSGEKWINLDPVTYKNHKTEAINDILNKLEIQYPTIRKHLKTIDLATPHTFKPEQKPVHTGHY